jgi:hypothetical protein
MEYPGFDHIWYTFSSYLNLTVYPILLIGTVVLQRLRKTSISAYLEIINQAALILLGFVILNQARIFWEILASSGDRFNFYLNQSGPLGIIFSILYLAAFVLLIRKENRRNLPYAALLAVVIWSDALWNYFNQISRSFLPGSQHLDAWALIKEKTLQTLCYAIFSLVLAAIIKAVKKQLHLFRTSPHD